MAPLSSRAQNFFLQRSGRALTASMIVGVFALAFPPLALLAVTLLALTAALRAPSPEFDWKKVAGPAFAALIVGALVGVQGAIGVLFVWRLFSDTRWSIAEDARHNEAACRPAQRWWSVAHLWAAPALGLAIVAYTAPHMIAGLPLDLPHIPVAAVIAVGVFAGIGLFDWLLRVAADWRLGEIAPTLTAHQTAHHALFLIAYASMIDVSAGLLSLIAWRLAHAALQPARALAHA